MQCLRIIFYFELISFFPVWPGNNLRFYVGSLCYLWDTDFEHDGAVPTHGQWDAAVARRSHSWRQEEKNKQHSHTCTAMERRPLAAPVILFICSDYFLCLALLMYLSFRLIYLNCYGIFFLWKKEFFLSLVDPDSGHRSMIFKVECDTQTKDELTDRTE